MNEDGMLDLKDWISAFQNDCKNYSLIFL